MVKRALVTGAKGHTGTFLVNLLADKGWEVVATDLPPRERGKVMTKEKVFGDKFKYMSIDRPGVKFIPADLTDKESLRALFTDDIKDYDVIFHPASLYDYFAELDILRKINVEGLRNFLEVIIEAYPDPEERPRFLHWSTCGVYGEPKYKKNKKGYPLPIDETAPYNPPNNYSISKMEQEKLLKDFAAKNNLKYTILRPAPIYGPYQIYGAFHIFYTIWKAGYMILPVIYPKKKRLMMPMIHVEDLVNAALFLAEKDEAIGEAYNIVGDTTTQQQWLQFVYHELDVPYTTILVHWSIYKLFSAIAFKIVKHREKKAKKWKIRPKFDTPMAGYLTHQYYFSNKKIRDLGFEFKYGNPYKGTRQTIRWYKDAGWFFEEDEFPSRLLDPEWDPDPQ